MKERCMITKIVLPREATARCGNEMLGVLGGEGLGKDKKKGRESEFESDSHKISGSRIKN